MRGLVEAVEPQVEAGGLATASVGGRPLTITRSFLDDLDAHPLEEHGSRSTRKTYLLFHTPSDRMATIEHARRILDEAPFPRSFVLLDSTSTVSAARRTRHPPRTCWPPGPDGISTACARTDAEPHGRGGTLPL